MRINGQSARSLKSFLAWFKSASMTQPKANRISQDWDGFDLFDLRYAIGLGLRYNTIIGPLRLDFAWKVNKQELDTRNYEVHFSLGQAF